jgi:hypothetical protein
MVTSQNPNFVAHKKSLLTYLIVCLVAIFCSRPFDLAQDRLVLLITSHLPACWLSGLASSFIRILKF